VSFSLQLLELHSLSIDMGVVCTPMSPATAVIKIFLISLLVTGANMLTCLLSAY